ncbi:MAG: MFS transporter [Solirubrobacteraceae bacterium]|nr:MFS transporter [Solirubrobacteraceae bacterium]
MIRDPRRRTIAVLWLGTWAAFLCVGIPLAVLPRYVNGELGLGDAAAGFAVGSLSLAAMLARPWGGRLADERSRRLVVGGGLALCTVGGLALPFVEAYWQLIAARMVAGFGESWVYAAAMAWALDLTPKDRHGSAIALFGMAIWLGATVGTASGEALLSATGGYEAVWWSVAVIPFVGLVLVLAGAAREAPRATPMGPRAPLILPEAVRPGLGLALANLGYGAVASLVTLHLADRGVGSPGLALTAVAAAVVITRLAVAWGLDRVGPIRVLAAGCAAQAAGLVLIAAAHGLPAAVAGGFLLGAGYAAVFPALALMVVSAAPDEQRGAALGSFTAFLDLGLAVAGPLAGATAALLGRPQAFLVAAALTLLALAVAPRGGGTPAPGVPRVPAESERL